MTLETLLSALRKCERDIGWLTHRRDAGYCYDKFERHTALHKIWKLEGRAKRLEAAIVKRFAAGAAYGRRETLEQIEKQMEELYKAHSQGCGGVWHWEQAAWMDLEEAIEQQLRKGELNQNR